LDDNLLTVEWLYDSHYDFQSSIVDSDILLWTSTESYIFILDALIFHLQKHNKSNYVELAGFDDKKLTVMPVPVPEVTYSDVKVDLR